MGISFLCFQFVPHSFQGADEACKSKYYCNGSFINMDFRVKSINHWSRTTGYQCCCLYGNKWWVITCWVETICKIPIIRI